MSHNRIDGSPILYDSPKSSVEAGDQPQRTKSATSARTTGKNPRMKQGTPNRSSNSGGGRPTVGGSRPSSAVSRVVSSSGDPRGHGSAGTRPRSGKGGNRLPVEESNRYFVPNEDHLLRAKRLQPLADQLSHSLVSLRSQLAQLEQKARASNTNAILPFQIRRAKKESAVLKEEVQETSDTIKRLLIMSRQMEHFMVVKDRVFGTVHMELEEEVEALRTEKLANMDVIREGYVGRINLLQRYWPWRQLKELGDTSVGNTFEEELARGPRYRNVGIQNSFQSDYIEKQLVWLKDFADREESFRSHVCRLEKLVEDLTDVNDLLESTFTCGVCGLLFEEPVLFWPCGHSFCVLCFDSLAIAPSLFRCPVCGSIGSEGYLHNILIAETVAKWMLKDLGYRDLQGPLNRIRLHLARFQRDRIDDRIADLRSILAKQRSKESKTNTADDEQITISYRAY